MIPGLQREPQLLLCGRCIPRDADPKPRLCCGWVFDDALATALPSCCLSIHTGLFFSCRNLHSLPLESPPSATCPGAAPLTCHRDGRGNWRFWRSRCTTCLAACPFQLLLPQLNLRVTPAAGTAAEQLTGCVQLPQGLSAWAFASPPAPGLCWLDTHGWQHPDDAGLSLLGKDSHILSILAP